MATDKNRCGWPGEGAGILGKGSEGPIKLSSTAQVGPGVMRAEEVGMEFPRKSRRIRKGN